MEIMSLNLIQKWNKNEIKVKLNLIKWKGKYGFLHLHTAFIIGSGVHGFLWSSLISKPIRNNTRHYSSLGTVLMLDV